MTEGRRSRTAGTARSQPLRGDASSFISEADWARIARSLRLSARESEIAFLALADTNEDTIADRLAISKHTVHSHIERLYRKLGIRSRSQLVVKLFEAYVRLNHATGIAADSCAATASPESAPRRPTPD